MIIPSLIRTLVEYNTVAISGFGTFYIKKISSQIKGEVIFPPQNCILFEYSKDIENFDFVNKLSQWEQLRIDEAQTQISVWIDLIEKGLEHNKSLFFDDFGTFSKDPSGIIVFQTVINSKLNIENEGLEPVVLPLKRDNKIIQPNTEPLKDKRLLLTSKKKKRDRFWFIFALSAASVLLVVLFFKDTFNPNYKVFFEHNDVTASANEGAFISNIAETEKDNVDTSETYGIESVAGESFPNDKGLSEESENNDIYAPFQKGKFYVIAGSFINESDALKHIKEKKLEKYSAKLVVQPQSSRVRVCIGMFDNENDAIEFAALINKNYWVLK
jgi:nucleoid DNA-binding protein